MAKELSWGIGPYMRPHKRTVTYIAILQIIGVAAQIASIAMLKPILDEGVYGNDFDDIIIMGAVLLLVTIIFSVVTSYSAFMASKIAAAISKEMRNDIVSSLLNKQRLDSKGSTTNTMTCLITDINTIQKYIYEGLRTYLPMPFLILSLIICTLIINYLVGVLLAITFALVTAITIFLAIRISKFYSKQLESIDSVNSLLRQKIYGARTIRAYNGKEYETEKFLVASKRLGGYNTKVALNSYYIPHLMSVVVWLSIVFIYTVTALSSLREAVVPTELILFMQFTTCFITTLSLIPYIVIEYPKAKASYSRLSAVMNAKDADTGVEKDVDQGGLAVEISDLTLTDNLGKKSLDGVALTIPKGGFVSLVGPNGCGGYNVAMTMLGFNKPVSGEVSVCGLDALRSSPELIRSRISYVSNSINILEGTMRFNLDPHGLNTDEEIMEICRKVGLDSFIDDLPNGLDSIVSDSKSSLSGGQKQLVLIARGLLKHPELYIFENCFYSLDVKTRERVFRTIKEIKDSTVVFVMNDTWTCNDSSKVILMDCGRVSDVGTHEELLGRSRLYADMCKFGQMKEGTWA